MPFTMAFSIVHLINKWEDKWRWLFSLFLWQETAKNCLFPAEAVYSLTFPKTEHTRTITPCQHGALHPLSSSADRITAPILKFCCLNRASPPGGLAGTASKKILETVDFCAGKPPLKICKKYKLAMGSCSAWQGAKLSGRIIALVVNPKIVLAATEDKELHVYSQLLHPGLGASPEKEQGLSKVQCGADRIVTSQHQKIWYSSLSFFFFFLGHPEKKKVENWAFIEGMHISKHSV